MRYHMIPQIKMNLMRKRFIDGTFVSLSAMSRELKISGSTVLSYKNEFQRIKQQYPERLRDMYFYMPEKERPHRQTPLYLGLVPLLPSLLSEENTAVLNPMNVYRKYIGIYPSGYEYGTFKQVMLIWISDNVTPVPVCLIPALTADELKQILKWRHSYNHRFWQIATVLKAAAIGHTIKEIMAMADAERLSVNNWLKIYRNQGLPGFTLTYVPRKIVNDRMQVRKDNVLKILHESPKLHGLNRTSWTITALTEIYNRVYHIPASYMQVSYTLNQLGYSFKKSRDMMTSQDPNFREKIKKIQTALRNLKPNEKFFSIDEYGPFSVKLTGGKTLRQEDEPLIAIPRNQKTKGWAICTAALELSTNQVSYFYSKKKNSIEMIKLVDLLLAQYKDQDCLYLSWDAASFHNAKILRYYIEDVNLKAYREQFKTPLIKLLPLPSCTQFLNVIESVFCGLAKAVIHNSDYASLDECKKAIDLHFSTRNAYFLKNPKHAGKKIWGKELVLPQFSETQQTRKRHFLAGGKK